jgi:hypothetical protein
MTSAATYHSSQRDERREQRRLERKETREKIMRATMDRFGFKKDEEPPADTAEPVHAARARGSEANNNRPPVGIEQRQTSAQEEESSSRWKKLAGGVKGKLHSLAANKPPSESEPAERK